MFRITRWADFSPMRSRSATCSRRQSVQVGDAFHQALVHQLIHQRLADAVDVHHRPGGEVQHRLLEPRGAVRVQAAAGGLAGLAHHVAAADRALLRHAEGPAARALLDDPHHLRDHVARALDSTVSPISTPSRSISSSLCSVARETVTPLIVTGLRCATGVSAPVRPTCTSIPSTTVDCWRGGNLKAMAQRGAFAVQPSWLLLRDRVHLRHHAVDFVGQGVAALIPVGAEGEQFVDGSRTGAAWG